MLWEKLPVLFLDRGRGKCSYGTSPYHSCSCKKQSGYCAFAGDPGGGAGPLVRYGLLSLTYRFLAAAAQPVSDKRLVEAFGTMQRDVHF